VSFVAMLPDQNSRWTNPNLRVYRANIVITTPHPGMRPGMSCSVEIQIEDLPDTLYVPLQSVYRARDVNVSFVSGAAGIERREVRVGRFNELWVQVLDGLREGEVVLLHAPVGFDAQALVPEPAARENDKHN
jgi:multidrug efflux pump subunit AcrA (membrane-fusion protein)